MWLCESKNLGYRYYSFDAFVSVQGVVFNGDGDDMVFVLISCFHM